MIRTWEGEVIKVEDTPAVDIKALIKETVGEEIVLREIAQTVQ